MHCGSSRNGHDTKEENESMNLDDQTSCPKWFPIFLAGIGFVSVIARQVLV